MPVFRTRTPWSAGFEGIPHLPPSTCAQPWKIRTNRASYSLPFANSPRRTALQRSPQPPESSGKASTAPSPSEAIRASPRWSLSSGRSVCGSPSKQHDGPPLPTSGGNMRKALKREYDFSRGKRGPVISVPKGKTRITIRLDGDILDWFREQVDRAGGGNYQTLINEALRQHIRRAREPLEATLRRVLREELHHAG